MAHPQLRTISVIAESRNVRSDEDDTLGMGLGNGLTMIPSRKGQRVLIQQSLKDLLDHP